MPGAPGRSSDSLLGCRILGGPCEQVHYALVEGRIRQDKKTIYAQWFQQVLRNVAAPLARLIQRNPRSANGSPFFPRRITGARCQRRACRCVASVRRTRSKHLDAVSIVSIYPSMPGKSTRSHLGLTKKSIFSVAPSLTPS